MTKTRVLVAHDAGARMFDHRGPGRDLVECDSVVFEDGRRNNSQINSDRQGCTFPRGGGRHAYEPHDDAKSHGVQYFAKTLAGDLAQAHYRGEFDQLILVAPPRFLGLLRDSLTPSLGRVVVGTLAKDLPRITTKELRSHLESYLAC